MVGRDGQRWGLVLTLLGGLCLISFPVEARPRESSTPIGGITFNPTRPATIRLKNRQTIRGQLLGISSELVHLRLSNGKEFQYDLSEIQRIQTRDGEFYYNSVADTFRELKERAQGLTGVTVEDSLATVDGRPVAVLPRPDPPALPKMVDPPGMHRLEAEPEPSNAEASARVIPAFPAPAVAIPPASTGAGQPFHETNAFKIGFLVSCVVVILLWWRNRVG